MLSAGELYGKCREAFSSYGMVCEPLAADFEMLENSTPAIVELSQDVLQVINRSMQEIAYLLSSANVSNNCVLDFSFINIPEYYASLKGLYTICLTGGEPDDECFIGLEAVCKNHNDLQSDEQRCLDLLNKLIIKCIIDSEFVRAKILAEGVVEQYMLYANRRMVF